MKAINLLNVAKANSKKVELLTKKETIDSLKAFKKEQAIINKAKRTEKQIEADKIKLSWLNDTQSKTALENYVKSNPDKFNTYLSQVNDLNKSSIKLNQVNKQLFKFGYLHELNKVDFEGNILEAKSFFNIAFFVANSNSLLVRFAKYSNVNSEAFISVSKKSTENYLDKKFTSFVKTIQSKGASIKQIGEILKNNAINRNEKAELLKALIVE